MPNQHLKRFFQVTYLHHIAAYLQNRRRGILRWLGFGWRIFEINPQIQFKIDIAARSPFSMFTSKDKYMKKEMDAFTSLTAGKKCFLDIGSHYGIYSMTFASINPDGMAYAIDPSPKCFWVLDRNMKLNPQMKITSDNVALGREQGEIMMHYEWVHLIGDHSGNSKGSPVNVTMMDKFIQDKSIAPDIIKIDVDGYEGPVIEGGMKYLSNNNPLIFLELHGDWIKRYDYSASQIHKTLAGMGYGFVDLDLNSIHDPEAAFNIFANRIICQKD